MKHLSVTLCACTERFFLFIVQALRASPANPSILKYQKTWISWCLLHSPTEKCTISVTSPKLVDVPLRPRIRNLVQNIRNRVWETKVTWNYSFEPHFWASLRMNSKSLTGTPEACLGLRRKSRKSSYTVPCMGGWVATCYFLNLNLNSWKRKGRKLVGKKCVDRDTRLEKQNRLQIVSSWAALLFSSTHLIICYLFNFRRMVS